jgi:hypothetical protein
MDLGTLLSLVVAVIFGMVAVIQTYRANKISKQSAEAPASITKSQIRIRLFNQKYIEHFIVAAPLQKGRILVVPLPISIANTGDKSVEDLEVFMTFSKDLWYRGKAPPAVKSGLPKVSGTQVAETKNLRTFVITAQTLHPKQGITLYQDVTLIDSTFVESKVAVSTRDGASLDIPYSFEFEYMIDIVVTQKDRRPQTRSFGIRVANTSELSVQKFLTKHNEMMAQRRLQDSARQPKRLFRRRQKAEWLRMVLMVEYTRENIVADPSLPVSRVSMEGTLSQCVGFETTEGFVFEGLSVEPEGLSRSGKSFMLKEGPTLE